MLLLADDGMDNKTIVQDNRLQEEQRRQEEHPLQEEQRCQEEQSCQEEKRLYQEEINRRHKEEMKWEQERLRL